MSTNKRIYAEIEDEEGKPQSSWSTLIAVSTLSLFVGFTYVLFVVLPLGCLLLSFLFIPLSLFIWSSIFWPSPTLLWKGFIDHPILKHCRRYFRFSYLFEEKLDPNMNYVICHFPHGVFPLGPLLAATVVEKIFPGLKVFGISADNVFRIPLYRHVFSWIGAQPATNQNFKQLLSKGSCGVVVGGLAEMYMQYEDHEELLLLSRKGFIRVAVETGSPLVPVYYFGNSRILNFGPKFIETLARKLRFSLGIIYGRFFTPIPFSVPIFMVVGKPIRVRKVATDDLDFDKTVDEVHKKFVEELKRVYDDHKEEYGWKGKPLVIK